MEPTSRGASAIGARSLRRTAPKNKYRWPWSGHPHGPFWACVIRRQRAQNCMGICRCVENLPDAKITVWAVRTCRSECWTAQDRGERSNCGARRIRHRKRQEKLKDVAHVQAFREVVDGHSVDIFHYWYGWPSAVWPASNRCATPDAGGSQDAPLTQKTLANGREVRAGADELDSDALVHFAIGPFGQEYQPIPPSPSERISR